MKLFSQLDENEDEQKVSLNTIASELNEQVPKRSFKIKLGNRKRLYSVAKQKIYYEKSMVDLLTITEHTEFYNL